MSELPGDTWIVRHCSPDEYGSQLTNLDAAELIDLVEQASRVLLGRSRNVRLIDGAVVITIERWLPDIALEPYPGNSPPA